MLKPADRVDFRADDETWRLHNQVVASVVLDNDTNAVIIHGLLGYRTFTEFHLTRKEYLRLGDGDITAWGLSRVKKIEDWVQKYLDKFDLLLIDPKTHDCQWENIEQAVWIEFYRRESLDIFRHHRWHKEAPALLTFWHNAGIIPKEHGRDVVERSTRDSKATTFKMPLDAYRFTGPDPYITAEMRRDKVVKKRKTPATSNG